ncbi:MAG: hypothetical protein HYW06_05955 [Gemmatimonadetes bacterium]|nr:hypothetical protein [Gemmatimonadota bacterium]
MATILDGERERREVMWQMARELVRLGEAIERQHVILSRFAEVVTPPDRALAAPAAAEAVARSSMSSAASAAPAAQGELDQLRQELARERELVERLRRSKLEIERRAAEAEAQLGGGGVAPRRGPVA